MSCQDRLWTVFKKTKHSHNKDGVLFAQLTTDGELDYSYGMEGGRGETNKTMEESLKKRKSTGAMWSPDSSRFALVRHDEREVEDLWVVHAVGNERPELESYKYLLRLRTICLAKTLCFRAS